MNPFARLRIVRVILGTGVVVRALAWGIVAGAALVAVAAITDLVVPLSLATRVLVAVLAAAGAIGVGAALAWRDRAVVSLSRVALWLEERCPRLEYSLITAVETGDAGVLDRERALGWGRTALRRAARVVGVPLAVVVGVAIVIVVLPAGAVARIRSPHAGDELERPVRRPAGASRLAPLVAIVRPPAYTARPQTSVDEPSELSGLVGSVVEIQGRGSAKGVAALDGADSLFAAQTGDRWTIHFRISSTPTVLRLIDRTFRRIVAIEPAADDPPVVTLLSPGRDSVLRNPAGTIHLTADASDDFGLVSAAFEYIVSSGEGETFTFKTGTLGTVHPDARHATLSASLRLDSLSLKPGDIVHVRAVARDANDVSGPGRGASETRAIRIARAGEYDSVSVEAAAPSDEQQGAISQRMLIMLAEALEKARPTLSRDSVVGESRSIATDERRLRRSIGDIVFMRLGGGPQTEDESDQDAPARARTMQQLLARADSATDLKLDPVDFGGGEAPVVAVNGPLLDAYNALWEATTELEVGEPGRALPHMRNALAAIQRARQAERVYLRGQPAPIVIDIDRARLQGKEKGTSSARPPERAIDPTLRLRAERLSRIVEVATRRPRAAIDSLLVLRIDALADEPAFAKAVGDAASAMRAGRGGQATDAFARARRLLSGAPVASDSIARWGVVP